MASSLLNKLKLIAGESIDTTDPTDPDNPNQAIIDRYKNVPGVNLEKLTEYVNLNIPEPQTIVDAIILAEAIGYTPEQAKVVGAQWAVESGRGVSTAGADYNYFGVKSHNDAVMKRMSGQYGIDVSQGDVVKTVEYINGERKVIEDTFASFNNPIEGFLGKKAFLETNKRYKKALNPENTADEFAQGLKDAGYATDPVYASKLANIYNGPMRTSRPSWMKPTRKSNVPQADWTMTGVQPTEGSRADLVAEKKSTSKNPIIAEYENFILAPEETKEWWYNIYKDDLESGKITEAELDKQIAIDKKEKNLKFQEYQKDPLAYIQDELDYALETREEGDDSYIASLEKVVNAVSPAPEKVEVAEKKSFEETSPVVPKPASQPTFNPNLPDIGKPYNLQKLIDKNFSGINDITKKEPFFTIGPVEEKEEELVLNPFTGAPSDAILDDITYNSKMPRMIGYTDESVSNYLKGKENYNDVVSAQVAAEEEYEKLATENAANAASKIPVPDPPQYKIEDIEEEIIPLQKPVQQEINMEYLNNLPDINSFISPGSFTNESRSKEQLKQDEEAIKFIMSPLQRNAKSGYFGSGQSMFYPSTRQQKYGGTIYPRYYNDGGLLDIEDPKELKDKETSLEGRVGPEIIPTYSFGQTPRKLGYESGYGSPFIFSQDSKKFDNFIDPISFNVDAETGNKKIYNLETGKFDVTDTPYENKGEYGVSMMSHFADMYEDDDMSPEAKAARIQKGKDMLKYSQMKANRAMQQFADRSDYSAEKKLGLREQGVSKGFWDTYKNQYQCISGSSSNCSPIPGMPMDKNQPNYATVPHFNKNRKGELILNTQKTAGTQKSGKGLTGPGDNIPNMGGNETFASWGTRNYGFEMTPPQSPLKEGQILVHHGYDDWKSRAAGVDNPPYKNTFQYGRVENWGPYHAQTVGNIGKESLWGDNFKEKEGYRIGDNPGSGDYSLSTIMPVGENVHRDTAQFDWVYDNPYYKKVLADIQKRNKLSKND